MPPLFALHARLGEVKNVSTLVSERQALSNLIRCSRSREPIMTKDSVSPRSRVDVGARLAGIVHRHEVAPSPTVSCWPRSGNFVKRLRSCVGMSRLLEWFLFFLATMVSSQFPAARSWEAFFACGLYVNALRGASNSKSAVL
jgi:hypothetical protein